MSFDLANVQEVGIGVTAFITTLIAVFLFLNAYKERLARTLGFTMSAFAVWAWFGFAFHLANTPELAHQLRSLSVAGQVIGQIMSLQFARVYLEEIRPLKTREWVLIGILTFASIVEYGLLITDAFGTQFFIGKVVGNLQTVVTPQPAIFFPILMALFTSTGIVTGYIMYQRAKIETGKHHTVGIMLIGSIVGAYAMGTMGFPMWFGIDAWYTDFRVLAIPLFAVAAFYSITNYQLFNMRVAAAEIFVFGMWGFLFFRILLHATFVDAIPDILVFIAMVVLGLLMIRNITKELAARIELERVSKELATLNNTLETQVTTRTRELARSQEHIETVVEHLPIGLIEISGDTRVVRINETAQRLFNIDTHQVLNTPLKNIPKLRAVFGERVHVGTFDRELTQPVHKDITVAVAPIDLEDGQGRIVIIRDITERRMLERAKNEFIATAAHQLRTPLAAVKWALELLNVPGLSKQQKEVIGQGQAGIDNMQRISEGLLMSIRTSEGTIKYTFVDTDLSELLLASFALLEPLAKKKHIQLSEDIANDLPQVPLDTSRFQFAVQNLLDNAIKYTPQHGTVSLSAHKQQDKIVITVQDTGIGISKEDQQHLFERFFRAQKATEVATDGSGLGLAIARSIIHAHKGTIEVDSHEGEGTTFTIVIPIPPDEQG